VEFRQLAELFRRHCGFHFGPESRYMLEKRLARRLCELELGSFAAYHAQLREGAAVDGELAHAVDELATNETYFLRERGQLGALVGRVLPELLERAAQRRPLSIWCAGCSSGEEPYSVVMLAFEAGLRPGVDLRVYASDISRRMLQQARRGVYRESSFRQTEPALRRKYFSSRDGVSHIADEVKKHVDFIHLNLLDRSRIALLGSMDVILCRNVIMYFDVDTRREVVQTLGEKLRPGGSLLLGHSESLMDVSSDFELCQLEGDRVYRKPFAPPRSEASS
jgi:chemotaxis protein methyltransferase CheR